MRECEREKSLDFQIRKISRRLHYATEQRLSQQGITSQQGRLLSIIHRSLKHGQEISRKYLQEITELSGPSVTSLLGGLEKKGYINRAVSEGDARALNISMTEKGGQLMNEIREDVADMDQQMTVGMTDAEIAVFRDLLKRAAANICK